MTRPLTLEKYLFLCLMLFIPFLNYSQNTFHSIGFSVNRLSIQPLEYLYISDTRPEFYRRNQSETKYNFPVSYHFRAKLKRFKKLPLDVSLDIPLEIAAFWSTEKNNPNHYFNLGLPVMLTANYGAFSFSEKEVRQGSRYTFQVAGRKDGF